MSSPNAIGRFLQFIRFSHTIFALPFALASMLVAARGLPPWRIVFFILLCMVFARTAAMLFNRIVDWKYDIENTRTAGRQRLVSKPVAIVCCMVSTVLFMISAFAINRLCGVLSPVALGAILFYSMTKRFTHFAQFFLGVALAVAPVGAWLAVTGRLTWAPIILSCGVILWVAGFDTIYATQDVEFDRSAQLYSLVVWLGIPKALRLALILHFIAFLFFIGFGYVAMLGIAYYAGLAIIFGSFVYEHRAARKQSIEAINQAFFASNAFVSFVFVASVISAIVLQR
ncbi:MAG: UbiA-like polyprenyltransferase [Chthoniobacterales bacterium]